MSELEKCYKVESLSPEYPYMPKQEWEARIADRTGGTGCPKCYKERRGKRLRGASS